MTFKTLWIKTYTKNVKRILKLIMTIDRKIR